MSDYFNLADFKSAVDAVLEISSPKAASESFMEYYDALEPELQPAARGLFIAMVDPNIRFGVSFIKLCEAGYKSELRSRVEIDSQFLLDLIKLGKPTKKDNQKIKQSWADIAGLIDDESYKWLAQALDKKIKMSIGKKIIAGMFPGHIKLFDVMLAHKFREKGIKFPVSVEPKIDGIRCITVCQLDDQGFSAEYFTRTGKEIPSMQKNTTIEADLEVLCREYMRQNDMQELILDSEVTAGENFNGTVSEIRRASETAENAQLCVFDILPEGFLTFAKDQWAEAGTYEERRSKLSSLFHSCAEITPSLRLNSSYIANSVAEIFQFYNTFRDAGLEGAIVKDRNCNYERKRSYGWMKIKANDTADLRIIGAFEGEGKYEGMLGGIIVDLEGVNVRVGGGFSDKDREMFWDLFKSDEAKSHVDDMQLVGSLAEVSYHEVTPDGSLRHPVFKGIRWDKNEANF